MRKNRAGAHTDCRCLLLCASTYPVRNRRRPIVQSIWQTRARRLGVKSRVLGSFSNDNDNDTSLALTGPRADRVSLGSYPLLSVGSTSSLTEQALCRHRDSPPPLSRTVRLPPAGHSLSSGAHPDPPGRRVKDRPRGRGSIPAGRLGGSKLWGGWTRGEKLSRRGDLGGARSSSRQDFLGTEALGRFVAQPSTASGSPHARRATGLP